MEPLLVVEGTVQKSGGTVNILAERLIPLRHEAERQRSIPEQSASSDAEKKEQRLSTHN
jgi:hypothetical protein